jgi:regulation of enolase protein 1 (concanavalin A-like superfamily)
MVYIDDHHWIKCGIEYCDQRYHASVVVTNSYSDWSVQPWAPAEAARTAGIRIRLHKKTFNHSYCVEFAPLGSDHFTFARIAHLGSSAPSPPSARIGPYACSPVAQQGFQATFSDFHCRLPAPTGHSADWH